MSVTLACVDFKRFYRCSYLIFLGEPPSATSFVIGFHHYFLESLEILVYVRTFKKRNGEYLGKQISHGLNLYHQQYCGCKYTYEAYQRKIDNENNKEIGTHFSKSDRTYSLHGLFSFEILSSI